MQIPLKVLLVEDNESDGALIIRQLEKANYDVIFERVESGKDMKLALEQKDWDIVISDFSLPQFTAFDSLQVLHDSGKDIPFVVVSGTIGESTAVDMMKSGAQDYLMKDNLARLAPAVGRELADARIRHARKHESLKLKESEAKFRAVWENSKDAISVSLNGIHVLVNPAYLALFGYDNKNDLLGKSLVDLVGPSDKTRINEYVRLRKTETDIPSEYETIGIKMDGTPFNLEVKVSNFNLNNEMHSIVILRDITERKKSDERLREELVNLTAAEKRAEESNLTKSFLMMNMSHEVRTPLNAILGFSSIISQESVEEDVRQMAERIRVSGERLLKTLDDILKLTQLQTGSEELILMEIELESELQRIISNYRPAADLKNIQLTFQSKQKVKVTVDPHLLNKAIGELLDNAIKFTEQGRVSIELNRVPVDNVPWIEIKVADTGIGISKEYHQVIFESFRQVSGGYNRSYEGTGLGLTIAWKIIDLMKGELFLESEIGKGSVFLIRLRESEQPFRGDEQLLGTERTASHEITEIYAMKNSPPLVLLVEDNEDNIKLTTEYCREKYVFDAVQDGNAAIQMARENTYDAILMDINLGLGMTGLDAAGEIKKMNNNLNTPIIAMTGFTLQEDLDFFLSNGCDLYLRKPFTRKEVLKVLENAMNSRRSAL